MQNSQTLYFNRDFQYSYVFHYNTKNIGEAGKLVEEFIIGQSLIDAIKITKYEMGEYFDVKYFVDTDFKKLNDGFKNILQLHEKMKTYKKPIYQVNYID